MSTQPSRTVIVLAAGGGTRMRSDLPKVLHPLLGRTLLGHVLAATDELAADRTLVVVGAGADQVTAHLIEIAPKAAPVHQAERRGTGHAVRAALTAAPEVEGVVLVLNGDLPLLRAETLQELVRTHETTGAAATLLTAELPDPTGLGRILRDPAGRLAEIVEERDATEEQRAIREVNVGAYAFDATALRAMLDRLRQDNAQQEEYLTDVPGLLVADGQSVVLHRVPDPTEAMGCNDQAELAAARAQLRDRVNTGWLRAGVTMIDPATTWVDVTVRLGRNTVIEPNTHLRGATVVGDRTSIGPDTSLVDTLVGDGAAVVRAHAVGAQVGPAAQVGPYAYLRPGTRLGPGVKVGTYVEVKNAELAEGAKVPHLSYVGDATIGEHTNIGAATVFVNYDGVAKHRTTIGRYARTGADNMFVAPVSVGDGAYTAAGSVVTQDVPPGALAVARGQQRNIEGWVLRRRPGTSAADAATAAGAPSAAATAPAASDADGPADPGDDDGAPAGDGPTSG